MSIFDKVVRQNFFVMGEPAIYTPVDTGEPKNITVMPSRPDEVFNFQSTPILTETNIFEIQVSEISNPKEDDTIEYKGAVYVVQGDPQIRDSDRLIWRIQTRPDDEIGD